MGEEFAKQKENPQNAISISEDCASNARCPYKIHGDEDFIGDIKDTPAYHFGFDEGVRSEREKQKEQKQTDLPAGFYYIDLDGNKYYSKEFRYGDMKVKVGEQKPVEWKINGEPIPTENYSVNIPCKEWSEGDEKMLTDISWAIRYCAYDDKKKKRVHDWFINRLKSLRPQWKPSEEQMNALQNAVALTACDKELARLYNQLKKL